MNTMMLRSLPVLLVCSARSCLSFVISKHPNDVIVCSRNNGAGGSRRQSQSPLPPALATSLTTGGEGGWEWDGVVEEGAHDAEFWTDNDEDEIFIPSAEFFTTATSVASPGLAAAAAATTVGPFDSLKNSGTIHRPSIKIGDCIMSEEILIEIGGDPAFLDDIVDDDDDDAWSKAPVNDDDFFWDGTVDEDAHNE